MKWAAGSMGPVVGAIKTDDEKSSLHEAAVWLQYPSGVLSNPWRRDSETRALVFGCARCGEAD
jgi:hypothetical protein